MQGEPSMDRNGHRKLFSVPLTKWRKPECLEQSRSNNCWRAIVGDCAARRRRRHGRGDAGGALSALRSHARARNAIRSQSLRTALCLPRRSTKSRVIALASTRAGQTSLIERERSNDKQSPIATCCTVGRPHNIGNHTSELSYFKSLPVPKTLTTDTPRQAAPTIDYTGKILIEIT